MRDFDGRAFKIFLREQEKKTIGTANSMLSYVNGASRILGRDICGLAQDEKSLKVELEELSFHDAGRYSCGLKALYRFYHNGCAPDEGTLTMGFPDEDLRQIVCVDGTVIKNLDTPIYRYIKSERYYDLIENRYNALTHISCWQDPYEGFVYRSGLDENDGLSDNLSRQIYDKFKSVYGQSWTVWKEESDVMWRAVADGERGDMVRIKTTVRKLAKSILCQTLQQDGRSCKRGRGIRIAPIEYVGETELGDLMKADRLAEILGNGEDQLKCLFFKRKEFSLEQEVRVAVIADESELDRQKCRRGDLLKFSIDPVSLIEEVLVDPCMERRDYERCVCRTKHVFQDCDINISQSKLFQWPKITR